MTQKVNERDCISYKVPVELLRDTSAIDWNMVQRNEEKLIPIESLWDINYTTGRLIKKRVY
jgi:hypothetical protein